MSSSFEFGDWIFLLTSIFETLMFCGFQTGWSSLVYVLVEEGIYSHLCDGATPHLQGENSTNALGTSSEVNVTSPNNCLAQQEMLNLAYTLATSVSSLTAFPIGIVMDIFGPRFTRIISGFLLGFSCVLLSYLDKQNPDILFVGLIAACIANLMMFMTPQVCMQRFRKGRSVLIGVYCGSWISSSVAFLGFKVLYEIGSVDVAIFFRFLAVGCVFLCINAVLLYPDSAIPPADEKPEIKATPLKNHKQFSSICKELKRYKLCLGHMINGKKNTTVNSTDKISDEWNQLLPKVVIPSVENSSSSKTKVGGNELSRETTMLNLPKRSSNFLGPSFDVKGPTYAECPTFTTCSSSKESSTLIKSTTRKDNEKLCKNGELHKTPEIRPEACQKRDEERQIVGEKSCQTKDPLDNRSTDIQVWTANSAASYLKSGISFKHCVTSPLHIFGQVFLTVCKVRTWFFVGTFSNFISDLTVGDRAAVAQYVNIFGISHVTAIFMGPLFGYIIDRQCSRGRDEPVKPSKDMEKQHQKFMMDIEATPKAMDFIIQCSRKVIFKLNDAVLVSASSIAIFSLLTLVPSLTLQIITFQIFVFVKVAYDTTFASILIIIFPQNHLGKLMGLAALIGAIFSLIQYPLFIVMEVCFGGRTIEVNIILWVICLPAFGFPLYLWHKASRQEPHRLALVAV